MKIAERVISIRLPDPHKWANQADTRPPVNVANEAVNVANEALDDAQLQRYIQEFLPKGFVVEITKMTLGLPHA